MPPRKGQKEATRQKLLEAAARAFAGKGYASCTVGDIAREAGMSQGALYVHFKSKEELFLAMVANEHAQGAAKARQALEGRSPEQPAASPQESDLASAQTREQASALESILVLLESCIRDVGFPVDHALWTEILAVAAREEAVRAAFVASDAAMRTPFIALLEKAARDGEIRRDLDFEAVSIWLYALVDGLIARKAVEPDISLDRHLTIFKDLVRSALGARPGA